MPTETRDHARARRARPFGGGASLAFVLLVLMGVSGAAVLDPALGVWSVVAAGRADSDRASRSSTHDVRIVVARDAHAERRLCASLPTRTRLVASDSGATAGRRADAPREHACAGRCSLPPPSVG